MKQFKKKESLVYAVQFENQSEKELSKILGEDCKVSGNAWEKQRTIIVGKSKIIVVPDAYIIKDANNKFSSFDKEVFESLFEECEPTKKSENTTNANKNPYRPDDVAILDGIDTGIKEGTLTVESLSDYDKALFEAAKPYKNMTVKELKTECKNRDLANYSKLRENELVVLLINNDKGVK